MCWSAVIGRVVLLVSVLACAGVGGARLALAVVGDGRVIVSLALWPRDGIGALASA